MDNTQPPTSPNQSAVNLDELLPAGGFLLTYLIVGKLFDGQGIWSPDSGIYWATAMAVIISITLVAYKKLNGKSVSPMMWFVTILVTIMGIILIGLQEDVAVYMKPSLVNGLFSILLFGGLAIGLDPIKYLIGDTIKLPPKAWYWMTIRWAVFFACMALWNEFLWRTYCPTPETPFEVLGVVLGPSMPYNFLGLEFGARDAEGVWAWWRLGNVGVVFVFTIINGVFLYPYLKDQLTTEPKQS